MIKVKNLNKYFNKGKSNQIHVINDTSIELPSTGLISFLGHSGSGKTTLLNVIGGLDKANGSIAYDDLEMNKYNMHKIDEFRSKHIGYVFQNYNLLKSETVYDNLKIALEVIGVTNLEEIDKRIEYTLKAVGMYKYRKKKAYALSGGQQQRVSIARALIKNCKIIIADEPTGNLDSNNTIEVMNILKKISKDTLVLMVTHETDIASFYSDYIFELKDGSIVNQYDNNGDKTLKRDDSNTVYLKDMNKLEYETEIGNIKIYSDSENVDLADISLIVKNGTIFINSSQSIKIANNTNLKIVDSHYEDIKKADVEEFNYNTSWYRDLKENKHFIKKLFYLIKSSFISLKNVKKRIKFLYLALAFIGLVWAISIVALINATIVDVSTYSYNENYTPIREVFLNEQVDMYNELLKNDLIKDAKKLYEADVNFNKRMTYNYEIGYSCSALASYYDSDVLLYKGDKPTDNLGVAISKTIADKIIAASSNRLNYDLLINEYIKIGDDKYKITGITTNDNQMIYVSESEYFRVINLGGCFRKNTINVLKSYKDYRYAKNELYSDGCKIYSIIEGRDVDLTSSVNEVLISKNEYELILKNGGDLDFLININGDDFAIVGVFDYPYEYSDMLITNKDIKRSSRVRYAYFTNDEYELTEGRNPVGNNEIIVPITSSLKIGDVDSSGNTVVGKFVGDYTNMQFFICTKLKAVYYDDFMHGVKFVIKSDDMDGVNEILKKYDSSCGNMKDIIIAEQKYFRKDITNVFSILSIVLAIVAGIFVYLIMRSRMIGDIYSIGVYRSLGAKRVRLYFKYFIDNLILTTFTAFIGYVIGIIGYSMISDMANDIVGSKVLMNSNLIYILGGAIVYIFVLAIGMLPIVLLLRKTPSEINTKYDI